MGIARYAFTIFVGAFLLFQIEPLIAKYLLPWFGGTPTVWTTCLLFFQMLLLLGYYYAHLIGTRLTRRSQAMVHLGLIAACIAAMTLHASLSQSPFLPTAGWQSVRVDYPIARILIVLAASIGLPYFALSATAPLLQSWFARAHPDASPYRLYALSNLGSLLALLTYPFAIEPDFGLRTQASIWSGLFLVFAIGMTLCALPIANSEPDTSQADDSDDLPTRSAKALWLGLSASASILLYGATGQITQDIAPIPFLWVLPLALYLLTFIICFDNDRWYRRELFQPLLGAAILFSILVAVRGDRISYSVGRSMLTSTTVSLILGIGNVTLLMFAGCMVCNGELLRLKPHRRDLTTFYLMVSLGGALGGIFSIVIAPLIFIGFWDFRFAVGVCVGLMTISLIGDRTSWIHRQTFATAIAITAGALALPLLIQNVVDAKTYAAVAIAIVAAGALTVRRKSLPRWLQRPQIATPLAMVLAVVVIAIIYVRLIAVSMRHTLWTTRNFYAVLRVVQGDAPDRDWRSYKLMSGRVEHGQQFFSSAYPQMRYYPSGYYGTGSGIGLAIMNHPKRAQADSSMRIGVVGLGAGAMAAWGRPGDYVRFYEINPAVIKVATDPNGYFTYVHDSSAYVEIVPGDARLSMERELDEGQPQRFDVLAIDAFNGDVVPTHLLSREAMLVYLRELAPDGVLAVHVSNLYLDLRPVLAENSRILNLRYGAVHVDEKDMANWSSDWVLLARDDKLLGKPEVAARLESREHLRRIRPWTDDYSNLFQLLK